jgi:AraC-like DNA-binding protein
VLLKLPYINPHHFADTLVANYGLTRQELWNATLLTIPPQLGEGSMQLFIRSNIHFYRGKWKFNEQTTFRSDDPVGKMGIIDFRINSCGLIKSAVIEGSKKFEHDTTEVDGLRFFIPEMFLNTNKTKLLQRLDQYHLDKNINELRKEVFDINLNEVKDSLLLESKILEFIHYWRAFLNKEDIVFHFAGLSDYQVHCVHNAKALIDQHIADSISIKELSKKVGLNECDLKRAFRQVFHSPVRQYIIKTRMEQARQMVIGTERPIQEICDALGYSNRGHFSNLYQRFFGIAPLADRIQQSK